MLDRARKGLAAEDGIHGMHWRYVFRPLFAKTTCCRVAKGARIFPLWDARSVT